MLSKLTGYRALLCGILLMIFTDPVVSVHISPAILDLIKLVLMSLGGAALNSKFNAMKPAV